MKILKGIREVGDIKGKKVLLRLDLNVPIVHGRVHDDYRIKRSLPTLNYLRDAGAKTIIIAHIENIETDSLETVCKALNKFLPVTFVSNLAEVPASIVQLPHGECVLIENLRRDPGEKANEPSFAKKLASLGDIYVNDAFSASHRPHGSIVGVPKLLPSYAGFLFQDEVANLSKALNPERPFLFILGGAKFETKVPLIEKFLDIADSVFVGGALANEFFKARGYELGQSLLSGHSFDLEKISKHSKLYLPFDVVVKNGKNVLTKKPDTLASGDSIVDAGGETIKLLAGLVSKTKFVLWNGPLGAYEEGFSSATESLAWAIAVSGAHSIIGGGDTLASVSKLGLSGKFSFISTGGGAMLDFLTHGTLPGIEALKEDVN